MAKARTAEARLSNGMTPRQMRWTIFLMMALSAGVAVNMLSQSKPGPAPSVEDLGITTQGAPVVDKIDPAARNICNRSMDTLVMCSDLRAKYPALSGDVITAAIQFSKYYGHRNPSALLALMLVESKGDAIDGFSSQSTAFGPFHYLVDTFSERLMTDESVLGRKVARANIAFIQKVKVHFPNNPALVDAVVTLANDYMSDTRADLNEIAKLTASIRPAGNKKEQIEEARVKLEAETRSIKTRVNARRLEMRDTLLKKYPQVVMAIQFVDVLTKVNPDKLFDGGYYTEHVLGTGGANSLLAFVEKEKSAKLAQQAAAAQKKTLPPLQKAITATRANVMLAQINAMNGTRHRKMIIPATTTDVYPAFQRTFTGRAAANVGVFFKIQRVAEIVNITPATKGGATTRTVYHTTLTPRTAAEVQAEILRRWEEHHVNARLVNPFAHLGALPTAPSIRITGAPATVKVAQTGVLAN